MSIVDHAPQFSTEAAKKIVKELYGITADVSPLPSERDQNFLVRANDRYVLKIANAMEDRSMLEAQNAVMDHLTQAVDFCPRVIRAVSGEEIACADGHFVRMVTYLPGKPLGNLKRRSPDLYVDLGRKIGQIDSALQSFDHPALHRDFHWDLANGLKIIRQYETLIADPDLRDLVFRFADSFEKRVDPILPNVRKSIIHNDANDYNVLVGGGADLYSRDQNIVGLIDFGDMVHSYTVGDLALTIAYAILDQDDPLMIASQIVRGYHSAFALTEDEISALFGLITLRLCMSVAIAADQQRSQPENEYLGISQQPIRKTLPRLAQIHPRFAEAVFRHACGLSPRSHDNIARWIANHSSPIVDTSSIAILDMSVGSPFIGENAFAQDQSAKIKIGQYDEARFDPSGKKETIHLAVDLFGAENDLVTAPLDGVAHAVSDNDHRIVIEHRTDEGELFYTIYHHVQNLLKTGQTIRCGEQFGSFADQPMQFQIVTDLLDGDFPVMVDPDQREAWKDFALDPNLILKIDPKYFPPKFPAKDETLIVRKTHLGRNLSIAYRRPLKIVRGWKQYLFDDEGRRYIDSYNNVAHVGHAHPRVVEAGRKQMGVLNTNTRYLHDLINRYAEEITALLPDPLSVCYFVNSGSEANELALRLAKTYTGQNDLIVLEAAYHGNTNALIDISPYKHNGPGGKGAPDWVHAVPIPDDYRGAYKRDDPLAGVKYAQHVGDTINMIRDRGRGLAGYIAESLPSVGGQIILPQHYLAEVYRHVRAAGGVCIADEVQTGFGRVGSHFWGFEMQGVVPDIVVLGKPIGNGHPIGAVITTPGIADAFNNGMEFFSTFGGNPVSCAIGLEVLNVVRDEGLQDHARRIGGRMLASLQTLNRFPIVGDVRGTGLFLGVELVKDRSTLEPAADEASFVANRMRDHNILLGTDGPFHNVVKIRPPMPFDESNADELVRVFEKILVEDF